MSLADNIFEVITKLTALEARTADVMRYVEKVDSKLDNFLERLTRIEEKHEHLRNGVKNEILADIKADIVRVHSDLNYQNQIVKELIKESKNNFVSETNLKNKTGIE